MLSRLLLIILVSFPLISFSNAKIDSLKGVLNTLTEEVDKFPIYREIYKSHPDYNSDTVLYFLSEEQILAEKFGRQKVIAKCHYSIGLFHRRKGSYDNAIANLLQAARIFQNLNMYQHYADVLNNLGLIAMTAGNFESALKFFDKSSIVYEYFNENKYLVKSKWNMGICFMNLSEFDKAHYMYEAALRISQELKNEDLLYKAHNYLGELAVEQCQYSRSREHYNQAIIHAKNSEIPDRETIIVNNIGRAYLAEGDYTNAEVYLTRALDMKKTRQGDKNSVMITLTLLGELEIQQGKILDGIAYLEQGIELADVQIINKDLSDAIKLLNNAYQIARKKGMKIDIDKSLAASAILANQHEKLWFLKKRLESNDIQNALYFRIEMEKKDSQLASISKANEIKLLMSIILSLVVVILVLMYKNVRASKDKISTRLKEVDGTAEEVIKILKQQTFNS